MVMMAQGLGAAVDDGPAWSRLLTLAHGGAQGPAEDSATAHNGFERLYGPIAGASALVIGQLGQSLDGRIATESGHSHYVNGAEALVHLHRLRALVQAVVVGVGTVLADDPLLTVRRVAGPNPVRVVLDPRGRMQHGARLLQDRAAPVLVVQGPGGPIPLGVGKAGMEGVELPCGAAGFDPQAIVSALAARGLRRVLIEGGARTVSGFVAAGALDRLHVCVAPLLIGSGVQGLSLPPVQRLEAALRAPAAVYQLGTDVLFDLDLRAATTAAT